MLKLLRIIADWIIHLSAMIGAIGLIVELMIILADVVGRYFGHPIAGAQDISQMTLVILIFGGMAMCDRNGGHISVDLFEQAMPDWMNRTSDILGALLGAAVFATIAWHVYESSKISQMLNLATNVIYLPKAYFQWALSTFASVTALGMLLRAVEIALTHKDIAREHAAEPL